MPTILVTGCCGYIASHIVAELRRSGHEVIGTVRSLSSPNALALKAALEQLELGGSLQYEVADLLEPDDWSRIFASHRIEYVVHVASPVSAVGAADAEEKMYKPAVAGTLNVLRAAAAAAPPPKRVVLTSSVAAMLYGHEDSPLASRVGEPPLITAAHWTVEAPDMDAYSISKVRAERAAWDFVAEHPSLELVAICPTVVLGSLLIPNASHPMKMVVGLSKKGGMLPDVRMHIVGVRDVAKAHCVALTHAAAAGQRFICSGSHERTISMQEVATVLGASYTPVPRWLIWALAHCCCSAQMASTLQRIGLQYRLDTRPWEALLGSVPQAWESVVREAGSAEVDRGRVF